MPEAATGIDYDSRCIGARAPLGAHRLRGGICSLDSFHPTMLGYRYVARSVTEAVEAWLPGLLAHLPEVTIQGDTLLERPPFPALATLSAFWPFGQEVAPGPAAAGGVLERLLRIGGMR